MKYAKLLFALALGLILVASAGFASATYDYTTRWYYNGNPVINVRALTLACTDTSCYAGLGTTISDLTSSPGSNAITVSYPVPASTYGYATFWFASGYRAKKLAYKPTASGSNTIDVNFIKYSNCQAGIISVIAPATINEGEQIAITANVMSAFSESSGAPYAEPPDADIVQDYFSAQTDTTLTIRNSTNDVVYTNTNRSYIFADNSKGVLFNWTPDYNQAGVYTIRVSTDVSDSKCSSGQIMQYPNASQTAIQFTVNNVPDSEAPKIQIWFQIPISPANYAPGQVYAFNSTWTDNVAVNSVWLEFNGINYSTISSGNIYSTTINDLSAGNYNYKWFANDSSGNTNSTAELTYTISKAVPQLSILITPSSSVENGTQTNATASGYPSQLACILYRDGLDVSNPDIQTFDVGTYNYVYNTTGNENYSAESVNKTLNVWKPGSSSADSNENNKIIDIDSSELSNGYSFSMNIGDKAKLSFCGAPYYIKLNDIDEADDKAYFSLTATLYNFVIEEDEREELDLNRDGAKDVSLRLEKISSSDRVKVNLKRISDRCLALQTPKEELQVYGAQTGVLEGKKGSLITTSAILLLMSGIFLSALAILLYSLARLRRIKKKSNQQVQKLFVK